jgi:Tfp pilus assembly protein PilX
VTNVRTNEKAGNFDRFRERGSVLAISLLVSVFMAILAVPFVTKYASRFRLTGKSFQSLAASNLAEAGLERAIWELNFGNISSWSGTSAQRTLSISNFTASSGTVIGNISITVNDPAGMAPVIESTGTAAFSGSQNISKTMLVVLKGGAPPPLFNFMLFGALGVNIGGGAIVDSYDSRLGAYGGTNIGSGGNIGTNGDIYGAINLGNGSIVNGSAMTGPESDPNEVIIMGMGADITGETAPLAESKDLPSVPVPTGLANRGNLSVSGTSTTISQSGQYNNLTLANNSRVTITSNVTLYVSGAFTLNNGAEFKINSGCSVTLYFGGGWAINSTAKISNMSHDPTKLVMYGTDTFTGPKTFCNGFETYAAMYFPKANVSLANTAAFYGSIIARQFSVGNNMRVHYDAACASLQAGFTSPTSSFEMKSWQEKII